MKRSNLLSILFFVSIMLNAQDIIVMKNGDLIQSKVQEITQTEVKYKKFSNPTGPLYTIDKAKVLSINYENGEKESFTDSGSTTMAESSSSNSIENSTPTVQKAQVDIQRNSFLIEAYNKKVEFKKTKEKNSSTRYALLKYGVTSESVLSNEDVEVRVKFDRETYNVTFSRVIYKGCYSIELYNKTSSVIYVDLGNVYKINTDGTYKTYFDGNQVSISNSKGIGVGLGLGSVANVLGVGGALTSGIGVSSSRTTSVTTTYNNQRIISIPPHAWGYISKYTSAGPEGKQKVLTPGEEFSLEIEEGFINKGCTSEYTEHNSPSTLKYVLTYSKDAQFSTYSNIEFGLYLQQVLGDYLDCSAFKTQRWDKIPKLIPDYGNGEYIILGMGENP